MKIFLICLLAGITIASEVLGKTNNVHKKRDLLTGYSSNGYNGQQLQGGGESGLSGHQQASGVSSGSVYTSGLTYTSGSLPIGYRTYSTGGHDNLGSQSTLQQFGQGSLVNGLSQPLGPDFQDYGIRNIISSGQPVQSGVIGRGVALPHLTPVGPAIQLSAPYLPPLGVKNPVETPVAQIFPIPVIDSQPVAVEPTVPVTHLYESPRPVSTYVPQVGPSPVEVPEQAVHINSGYENDVQQTVSIGGTSYGQESSIAGEDASFHEVVGTPESSEEHQQLPLESEQETVGNIETAGQVELDQSHDTSYQQQNFQPNVASPVIDHQDSGYRYDVPTKQFNL